MDTPLHPPGPPATAQTAAPAARSLADWLRGRSDSQLAELLAARPDVAVPVPADVSVLAARLSLRLSVLRAFDGLDRFTLQVLDGLALLAAAGTPSVEAFRALAGDAAPAAAAVGAAVERLRCLALVWGDDREDSALHLPGAVREVVGPHPAGLGRPVTDCLDRHTAAQLAPVLEALGLPATRDRGAAVAAVGELYGDRGRLDALLARCGEGEHGVLATLAAGPPLGQTGAAAEAVRVEDADTPVRWLLAHGLLVGVDAGTVELPREVGLALRGARPLGDLQPSPPGIATTRLAPADVDAGAALEAAAAVRAVEDVLTAWGGDPPSVLRAGGLGVRDLRRTAKDLDLSEATVALLLEAAHAAGLVDTSTSTDPEWLPTAAFDTWLAQPVEARWEALARAWLQTPRLAGLVGERDTTSSRERVLAALGPDLERAAAREERARALAALADLPAGSVPDPASLAAALAWHAPRRGGRLRERLLGWTLTEAAVLGLTGRGALSSPGRALLRGDEGEAAAALAPLLPEPLAEVLLQADLTVVAPGPLVPDLARELAGVADVESSGGATVYRVTESSVRRALDAGRTASELHAFFARVSRTPVPQGLTYLVDDVSRRHGVLRAGAASSYLRCDDPALLSEVLVSRRVEPLRLRRLAPTVVTAQAPLGQVLEVLRASGYAPAAESPDGALLVATAEARRTPGRSRSRRSLGEAPAGAEGLAAVVAAVREGDRAALAARRTTVGVRGGTTDTATTLALLQDAARDARLVLLGYVDPSGRATTRVVEPVSVEGGYLTAYDRKRETRLTYALHRVTTAALYDEQRG